MDSAMVLNGMEFMPKTKEKKKMVMNSIKDKMKQAKLNLIYTELDELKISHENNYTSVHDLKRDLKGKISTLDYNKVSEIADKVNQSLDEMVSQLNKGSTTAFSKLMTSDLAKTVSKTLGITLAGRTALLLAPTIGTKALVASGLSCYGIYRLIKNRKDIIKANEENELNNILLDLETTKNNDEFIDTRFSTEIQGEIKNYLKSSGVEYEDTGYRSLRSAIYSLDANKKKSLCDLLNLKLGKGIDVDQRIAKAKKKLDVVSSSVATVSAGVGLGSHLATTINSIDPGLASGVLNGTFLATWIQNQTNNAWYTALSGGLGLIGTEVLEHLPVIGGVAQKVFAAENLASFCALGAAGGIVASMGLGIASCVKRIHTYSKQKAENKSFLKLDQEKYKEDDQKEIQLMQERFKQPANMMESIIIDIVLGYLADENIKLEGIPRSIMELNSMIDKLSMEEKHKANSLLSKISSYIKNDPSFVANLQKAGKISIGIFTAGLAAVSIYDIVKGGTFIPELSQKLFPKDNIYTPVNVPPSIDTELDNPKVIKNATETYQDLNSDEYMTANDDMAKIAYGVTVAEENPGIGGLAAQQAINDSTMHPILEPLIDKIATLFGSDPKTDMIPDIPKIAEKLGSMKSEELYNFYRYFNNLSDDGSPMYQAVKEVLGYNNMLEMVSNYINGFERTQKLHDIINDLSTKIGMGLVSIPVALETLGIMEKETTTEQFQFSEDNSSKSL